MRGPLENDVAFTEAGLIGPASYNASRLFERPVGGKALQRLLYFAQERGLPLLQPIVASVAGLASPPATEGGAASVPEGGAAVVPEAADAQATATGYAQSLLDAALALEEPPPSPAATTATGPAGGPPTQTGPQWRSLGPYKMVYGQTYGESRVDVSGRVSAVAVDPANSDHILCGGACGGVWESRDRGATWTPRTDYQPTLSIGALAFDPTTPSVVYCGTGEGNAYHWLGIGVLRSTDGGTTWSVLATNPLVGSAFYDLVIDPANTKHLMGATNSGLFDSTDGGSSWSLRRGGAYCYDLAMHPAGGTTAEVLAGCSDGLQRSTDGGLTFVPVALPGGPATFDRLAVDIARSNPAIAYAFGASGQTVYLYRRGPDGTWEQLSNPEGLTTAQAWYNWFLAVAPDNDGQIFLGGIEAYRGTLAATTWAWETISNKTGDDIHPDQHAIAFDPANPNTIYIGNDGGLYVSPDRGLEWTSLNNGLGITEIEYLAQDYGSSRWLLAGTQDNGSIRYTGSLIWEHIADGDGGDCGVVRSNPDVVFHTFYGMGVDRSATKGDFGSFTWLGPRPDGYNSLFYPPMEVNNDTLAMAGQSVFISRNQGNNFAEVTFPAGGVASAMYIPNPDTVLVGTTDGRLFRTTWTGTAWSEATALTSPSSGAYLSDIHADAANPNRIWITSRSVASFNSRVFRSDDGGNSWQDCTSGLPLLPISAIEVDPDNPNRVWVAADVGVYQSLDGGGSWTSFANGLPNALAVDLLYQPHSQMLRVALRNRGVWEIPVNGWLAEPVCRVQWTATLKPEEVKTWYTYDWPATYNILWTIMPTTISPGGPQLTWDVRVERATPEYVTYWITITNITKQPVNFEGRCAILSIY